LQNIASDRYIINEYEIIILIIVTGFNADYGTWIVCQLVESTLGWDQVKVKLIQRRW